MLEQNKKLHFCNSVVTTDRRAILQTLNRRIQGICYPEDVFRQFAGAWSGAPVVYADEHPDMQRLSESPHAEMERLGGRVIGRIVKAWVSKIGIPRLMADVSIFDEEINKKIDNGKISLSTGFYAADDGDKITGTIVPNHVLAIEETDGILMPADPGSGFLHVEKRAGARTDARTENENMAKNGHIPETKKGERNHMTETVDVGAAALTKENIAGFKDEDLSEILNKMRTLSETLERKNAYANELEDKNRELETLLTEQANVERSAKFDRLAKILPKKYVIGDNLDETRARLNTDPLSLFFDIVTDVRAEEFEKFKKEGTQYGNTTRPKQDKKTPLTSGIFVNGKTWEAE